jgi:hypothetical protein
MSSFADIDLLISQCEDYMNEHDIMNLIKQCLHKLCVYQPDNPIHFLRQYFAGEQYDQVRHIFICWDLSRDIETQGIELSIICFSSLCAVKIKSHNVVNHNLKDMFLKSCCWGFQWSTLSLPRNSTKIFFYTHTYSERPRMSDPLMYLIFWNISNNLSNSLKPCEQRILSLQLGSHSFKNFSSKSVLTFTEGSMRYLKFHTSRFVDH